MEYDLGVVAWANSIEYIKTRLALKEVSSVHFRRGYKIKLLCLEGADLFKSVGVEDFGYEIIDCQSYYKNLEEKYKNIKEFYSKTVRPEFFFKNTIRWFVLQEFLTGRRVNVDGDLIVNSRIMERFSQADCDFYYPGSTCFVIVNEEFQAAYADTIQALERNPDVGFDHIRKYSQKNNIHEWGLKDLKSIAELDEEKLGAFAVHIAKLYSHAPAKQPKLACPPFIANVHGQPPLGRYLYNEFKKYPGGVAYEFRDDTHYLSGIPMAFMHYQENLHFILGCHQLLNSLSAKDELYRGLMIKGDFHRYAMEKDGTARPYEYLYRFIWGAANSKADFNRDFWDMRALVTACEAGGLSDVFNAERWHYPNVFI